MTTDIKTLTIDGIDVSKYSKYAVKNHITKATEPTRSMDFSMPTIQSIEQREIPEISVVFNYLPISLYREVFKATRKKEFLVTYYDQDYGVIRKNMFYLKDNTSDINFDIRGTLRGVIGLTLDMACTMNPLNLIELSISEVESGADYVKVNNANFVKMLNNTSKKVMVDLTIDDKALPLNASDDLEINMTTSTDGIVTSFDNNTHKMTITTKVAQSGTYIIYIDVRYTSDTFIYGTTTYELMVQVE